MESFRNVPLKVIAKFLNFCSEKGANPVYALSFGSFLSKEGGGGGGGGLGDLLNLHRTLQNLGQSGNSKIPDRLGFS